jgi:hypothetical protein
MPRAIEDLSPDELKRFITNYEREQKTEGGIYPLSELLVERLRRTDTPRVPQDVFRFILESAAASPDGKTTYQDVWGFLHPGTPWKGNYSIKIVGSTLGAVIAYSVRHRLPIVSTLVVQSMTRRLSDRAVQNIYDECKSYGVDVGLVPGEFVARETERATQIDLTNLPEAPARLTD